MTDQPTSVPSIVDDLVAAVPWIVVDDGVVTEVGPSVAAELGVDAADDLLVPVRALGTRLDDTTFEQLIAGEATVRVRLEPALGDRPVRLRRLTSDGERTWIEIRSLVEEMRLAALLRRSGLAHMLLTPEVALEWSMTSDELAELLPGDDPTTWISQMEPDDMVAIGRAIQEVGAGTIDRTTVEHRLKGDQGYRIVDTVESALHDPDLRGVLVRSRLAPEIRPSSNELGAITAPFAGLTVSDQMPIGVVVISIDGRVLHRNAVAATMLGVRVRDHATGVGPGEPWMLDTLADEHVDEYLAAFGSAVDGRPALCTVPSPTDPLAWLRLSLSSTAGGIVVLTAEDATPLVEAEQAVRSANRLLEAIDAHSDDLVVLFDPSGRARYSSASGGRVLGDHAPIERLDRLTDLIDPNDRASFVEAVATRARNPVGRPRSRSACRPRRAADDGMRSASPISRPTPTSTEWSSRCATSTNACSPSASCGSAPPTTI